ncbi:MAG: N-acetyltransferase [Pseudomonadota bacterium]
MIEPLFETVDNNNQHSAIDILAEAFADDPVMNWSCNHPTSIRPMFELTLPVFSAHGLSYMDGQCRGAAAWLGPHDTLEWPMNLHSVALVYRMGGLRGVLRMLRSGQQTSKHHPETPHYYLFAIGVRSECKGQGMGSALIREMLKRCDAEGVPAYLENSKAANLSFYEGHGFNVTRQIRFARTAPPLFLMWREPLPSTNRP